MTHIQYRRNAGKLYRPFHPSKPVVKKDDLISASPAQRLTMTGKPRFG